MGFFNKCPRKRKGFPRRKKKSVPLNVCSRSPKAQRGCLKSQNPSLNMKKICNTKVSHVFYKIIFTFQILNYRKFFRFVLLLGFMCWLTLNMFVFIIFKKNTVSVMLYLEFYIVVRIRQAPNTLAPGERKEDGRPSEHRDLRRR